MAKYQIETDDGKKYLIETEDSPTSSAQPSTDSSMFDTIKNWGKKIFGGSTPGTELGQTVGENVLGPVGGILGRAAAANPQTIVNQAPVAGMTAGDILGGHIMAGVGGATGEALKQVDSALLGKPVDYSSMDALAQIGKQGAAGVASSVAGKVLSPVINTGVDLASNVGKLAAKGFGKVAEMFSGLPSSTIQRLAEDPAAILPELYGGSMTTAKAGAKVGEAAKAAGFLPEGQTLGEKRLAQFAGQENPFKGSDSVAGEYFKKVSAGEQLSPSDTYDAYQAASESISKMSRKNPRYVEMVNFKDALGWELRNTLDATGRYADAVKDSARAFLGRDTSNILPRNKAGNVSLGRAGFDSMIFPHAGYLVSPPLAYGATTAAVSGGAKATAAALQNPVSRQLLFSQIVQNYLDMANQK